MATKKSSLLNMVGVLFIITVISAIALSYVNEITLQPKVEARMFKKLEAIKTVVPEFNNNPAAEKFMVAVGEGLDSLEFYPAKYDDEIVGYAIVSYSNNGFSGLVKIMIGLLPDGTIVNTSVLQHKETPGLGTKMKDAKFKDQFMGKHPNDFVIKVTKDKGQVDAITAATISSRAFCEAVQLSVSKYFENLDTYSGSTN